MAEMAVFLSPKSSPLQSREKRKRGGYRGWARRSRQSFAGRRAFAGDRD